MAVRPDSAERQKRQWTDTLPELVWLRDLWHSHWRVQRPRSVSVTECFVIAAKRCLSKFAHAACTCHLLSGSGSPGLSPGSLLSMEGIAVSRIRLFLCVFLFGLKFFVCVWFMT